MISYDRRPYHMTCSGATWGGGRGDWGGGREKTLLNGSLIRHMVCWL